MGFAIRRADGTYRLWQRVVQGATPGPGEQWEEHTDSPPITPSLAEQAALDAQVDLVHDAYVAAKAALTTFQGDSTLANAKPALLKLGLCVEELLKFLNKRIA